MNSADSPNTMLTGWDFWRFMLQRERRGLSTCVRASVRTCVRACANSIRVTSTERQADVCARVDLNLILTDHKS